MTSVRQDWLQAVRCQEFPAELRFLRSTLVFLAELMTADGTLSELRERMADVTGLPPRTLDRHLARAVEDGWLLHDQHASRGRRSRYTAAVPEAIARHLAARYERQFGGRLRATYSSAIDPRIARHLTARSKEDGERSERVALDSTRLRRPDIDDSRDTSPWEQQEQERSGGQRAGLRLIAADGQPVAERAAS